MNAKIQDFPLEHCTAAMMSACVLGSCNLLHLTENSLRVKIEMCRRPLLKESVSLCPSPRLPFSLKVIY